MVYIKNQEKLNNALSNPANRIMILELAKAYKHYYKAEENIDKFLYHKRFWMIEEGWTLEKCEKNRNYWVSKSIGIIFDMNRSSSFLGRLRKDEFIPALNEIYNYINNHYKASRCAVA